VRTVKEVVEGPRHLNMKRVRQCQGDQQKIRKGIAFREAGIECSLKRPSDE
jgi:hypothetical protein